MYTSPQNEMLVREQIMTLILCVSRTAKRHYSVKPFFIELSICEILYRYIRGIKVEIGFKYLKDLFVTTFITEQLCTWRLKCDCPECRFT